LDFEQNSLNSEIRLRYEWWPEVSTEMTGVGENENWAVLAEHRLERTGLEVKLDKGFEEGTYCVCIEFDELASRQGFTAAHRLAERYCAALKGQLGCRAGYSLGQIEDASRAEGTRRKRDLESTFLSFDITTGDGRFHDARMQEDFRLAFLRAGQAWDQVEARAQAQRRKGREEEFRRQLARLLEGSTYEGIDVATKERLLAEVPALAFARKSMEL